MATATILKIIMLVAGVMMFVVTINSLAKKKMNESFCLAWGLISVAIMLAALVLNPVEWNKYISVTGLILILIIFFAVLYAAYFISLKISELSRKNQELAIQVSLLNEEHRQLIKYLAKDAEKNKKEE